MRSKWSGKELLGCVVLLALMLFLAVPVLVLVDSGFAKMYEEPKSFSLKDESLEQVERKILPEIDIKRLLDEDRERGREPQKPGPQRFAVAWDVVFTLDNCGTLQTLADGRLWRLRIQSPGAKSLNLGITRFHMPVGAKLWIYDPRHKHVEGPYTARHRSRLGSLWTPLIEGDEIVVEVFVPAGVAQPVVEIRKVNRGYRGFSSFEKDVPGGGTEGASENRDFEKDDNGGGHEGPCENDVVCEEGHPWRDQIRAVGRYSIEGVDWCTGTLMNNTNLDGRPYFLSANHCMYYDKTKAATVVVYWNYESATCGTHGPVSTNDNQSGATYLASDEEADFLLLELDQKPHPSFKVFYAGWDATDAPYPSTVGIHHPQGDVKAISFSNSPPHVTGVITEKTCTDDPLGTGTWWCLLWNSGITENGSSGSCLFEITNKRCIGHLKTGYSECEADKPNPPGPDYYVRLSVSWNKGLVDWLDNFTGALILDGEYGGMGNLAPAVPQNLRLSVGGPASRVEGYRKTLPILPR